MHLQLTSILGALPTIWRLLSGLGIVLETIISLVSEILRLLLRLLYSPRLSIWRMSHLLHVQLINLMLVNNVLASSCLRNRQFYLVTSPVYFFASLSIQFRIMGRRRLRPLLIWKIRRICRDRLAYAVNDDYLLLIFLKLRIHLEHLPHILSVRSIIGLLNPTFQMLKVLNVIVQIFFLNDAWPVFGQISLCRILKRLVWNRIGHLGVDDVTIGTSLQSYVIRPQVNGFRSDGRPSIITLSGFH